MKRLLALLVLVLAVPVHAEVTFTLDDGARSQIDHAYPVLFKYHYPATAYLITNVLGHDDYYMDWGDVKTLELAGWDLEAHTRTHPHLTALTSHKQFVYELDGCIHDLAWHGIKARHFATPFGDTDARVDKELRKRFVSVRAGWVQINELNPENKLQRYNLSAFNLNDTVDVELVKRLIEHGTFEKRWLILVVHNVYRDGDPRLKKDPKGSIRLSKFTEIVRYCNLQGTKVVTVDQYFKIHHLEK